MPDSPRPATQRPLENTATRAPSVGASTNETTDGSEPTPEFAPSAEPGELGRLGKYRIVKELGRGGMGAVYLAFDERLQRKVALKVILPKAAANATAKDRFLREARAAAQISSDYVVNIHEADEIDGIPYISLQYLQGVPLDEYLKKKGTPTLAQSLRIARETALGLAAAHKLGLIHRDIKPGNIWLEAPSGRVKILDFGLAKTVDTNAESTNSGAIFGTPAQRIRGMMEKTAVHDEPTAPAATTYPQMVYVPIPMIVQPESAFAVLWPSEVPDLWECST